MPLKSGYSRAVVSANVAELRRSGLGEDRAVAAALRSARRFWRRVHPVGRFPRHLRRKFHANPSAPRTLNGVPVRVTTVKIPPAPKVGVAIGKLHTIIYESKRSGKARLYRHDFGESSRPLLIAPSDGKPLILIGGSYRVNRKREIVDRA